MGLPHPSQAECMHALLFGSLHVGRLIKKRRYLVARMGHYWKLKFSGRGKTDGEKQNIDRKIGILIFFLSVYRQENTARNIATEKYNFFCQSKSFPVGSPIFLSV
jgi:hypothetical protein